MGSGSSSGDRPGPTRGGSYCLVVLGGGPAGIAAAREAARRRVRLALVLPATADTEPPHTPLREHLRQLQARFGELPAAGPPELFSTEGPGIDVYRSQAVFCRPRVVAVQGSELRFRKALIATGAASVPREIEGADSSGCLTPETLLKLAELPRRLAVIGAGAGACQWAQAFGRLGSEVDLIARERAILPREDPDAADAVRSQIEQAGIRLHLRCDELAIDTTGNLRGVLIEQNARKEKLLVEQILFCGPRRPNTAGLGLPTAAVDCNEHRIFVDDRLRTTQRHIFAAGAVCGERFSSPQAAEATARLAVHNALCIRSRKLPRLIIPHCVYTEPAVAQVGLTRRQADQCPWEVDTYRTELAEAGESTQPEHRRDFIAVYVRRRGGRIVGATVVANDADELIAPLVLLMTRRWPLAALADVIPCCPSRFELLTRLAARCARRNRSIYSLVRRRQTSR